MRAIVCMEILLSHSLEERNGSKGRRWLVSLILLLLSYSNLIFCDSQLNLIYQSVTVVDANTAHRQENERFTLCMNQLHSPLHCMPALTNPSAYLLIQSLE